MSIEYCFMLETWVLEGHALVTCVHVHRVIISRMIILNEQHQFFFSMLSKDYYY